MDYLALFRDKKITLMGLGLLGRGIGDAAFLAEAGADLTVTDLKTAEQLATSLDSLKRFKNIKFVLGEHRLEDFQKTRTAADGTKIGADIIVKAAGVPMDSPFILEAQKNDVPVVMSTSLFAEYTEAKIVGVTGTRGKSTVSYLLYEILKAHAEKKGDGSKVALGGNVLGVSTIDLLPKLTAKDTAVLELDSWQLQGFGNSHNKIFPEKSADQPQGFSPKVSVFTTFMFDHMNYYTNDLERYFADKANIYRFQEVGDILVVSQQVTDYIKKFGPEPKSKMIIATASDVPDSWKIQIPGEHNRLNVALAMRTAIAMGVPEKTIEDVVASFRAVPGRLEHVRTHKGVDIYNDTNATTPDATLVGLKGISGAIEGDKKTILIFGGADKKLDPAELLSVLPKFAKAFVVLPGTGTDLMKEKLMSVADNNDIPLVFVKSMQEAVDAAIMQVEKGDRILMSPAFASFGLFKNEYDRGDQFNAIVKAL
jgi:UDP-N-acetylmuramoylalanine--D-glutamate ligase